MSNVVATVESSAPVSTIAPYTSIVGNDMDARLALFSAVATSALVDSILNKEFALKDLVIEPSTFTNEVTGEVTIEPRITFVDVDGHSFRATSAPLYRDVLRMLGIVGEPHTWTRPLKIVIAKEGTGTSKYFTLKSVK